MGDRPSSGHDAPSTATGGILRRVSRRGGGRGRRDVSPCCPTWPIRPHFPTKERTIPKPTRMTISMAVSDRTWSSRHATTCVVCAVSVGFASALAAVSLASSLLA
jgi:hypothetical protein